MKKFSWLFVAIAVLSLLACTVSRRASKQLPLQSTYWVLTAIEGQSIADMPQPKTPYIIFDTNDKYHGHSGCNQFFGSYNFSKKKLHMDYAGTTRKMCSEMQIEKLFEKALHKEIKFYTITGGTLILKDEKKNEVLRFLSGTKPAE
jgi:putative lipoprotein